MWRSGLRTAGTVVPCASPPPIRRMEMGNHLSRRSPKQSQDLGQELSPFGGEAGRVRPDAGSSVRGAGWRGPSALAPPRTESRLAGEGVSPDGTRVNLKTFDRHVIYGDEVKEHEKILLNDAQTSGGLLIFVPQGRRDKLIEVLSSEGILAAHIGDVVEEKHIEGEKRLFVER